MEEVRKEYSNDVPSAVIQPRTAPSAFDIFSFFPEEENPDSKMEIVPFETLFPPTPLKEAIDNSTSLFSNPKFSLDRTLFGDDIIQEHLSQIEMVRKVPGSPSPSVGHLSTLDLSGIKDESFTRPPSLFEEEIGKDFSPSLQKPSPTMIISTPIKDSISGIYEDSIPIPSPIEATRILGSPTNISEFAKILAFNTEEDNNKISDKENYKSQDNQVKGQDQNTRKRHKPASKGSNGISIGEKRALVSFNMDSTTELTSAAIQAQLGSGSIDTLLSIKELLSFNFSFKDESLDEFVENLKYLAPLSNSNKWNDLSDVDPKSKNKNFTNTKDSKNSKFDHFCDHSTPNADKVYDTTNAFSDVIQGINVFNQTRSDNLIEPVTSNLGLQNEGNIPLIEDGQMALDNNQIDLDDELAFIPQINLLDPINGNFSEEIVKNSTRLTSNNLEGRNENDIFSGLQNENKEVENTLGIIQALNESFGSSIPLSFNAILTSKAKFTTRRYAALGFYQILRLASKGTISVDQMEPFGEISLYLH